MLHGAFWGGFECSSHRRGGDRRRLDVIATTQHDRLAAQDYRRLQAHGLSGARDGARWHLIEAARGRYDWASLDPMIAAARATAMPVIWDLLHYGWPDWTSPFAHGFPELFAEFAAAAARRIGPGGWYVPVNEISFLAWAGGQAGYLNPFETKRGDALKRVLCRAAILATAAIRAADPGARFAVAEPAIHVVGLQAGQEDAARAWSESQFHALDTLLGRRWPELGGREDLVDAVGLNYYPLNQFSFSDGPLPPGHPQRRPLADLIVAAAERYRRPLFIAETGCESDARPAWLAMVADQVRAANARGAGVAAICWYPIMDHAGWDDDRACPNGLFDGHAADRPVFRPLADELARQIPLGLTGRGDPASG